MYVELSGSVFDRLTVLRRARGKYWKCSCVCGKETVVPSDKLKSGHTTSCGCYRLERMATRTIKHGGGRRGADRDPVYVAWQNMKRRCYSTKSKAYKNYGGRGIRVCDEWLNDFARFKSDMGDKPTPKHTLERVNNDGNYESRNCKWATRKEQYANRRKPTNWRELNGYCCTV